MMSSTKKKPKETLINYNGIPMFIPDNNLKRHSIVELWLSGKIVDLEIKIKPKDPINYVV